ncbi:MAG TPA: UTP--glucose-1-phosphate uridylyltransferase [Candidatus Dormibacteraeota bacterium]|nr:UTP--glucose-1-phosphate uridylyltransferase [Candidatus Dormibacteraeota bacterium]
MPPLESLVVGAVRTVVVPAGGLGTRFLPATKALPKEMVPVGDRPSIQWGIEEAVASGIERAVIVTAPGKELIKAHFAPDPDLEATLQRRGAGDLAQRVRQVSQLCQMEFVEQPQPLGLGHAVWCAAPHVRGEEAVAVMLPDDLFAGTPPLLGQLIDVYRRERCTVLALRRCPKEEISRYGVAAVEGEGPIFRVLDVVEKPAPADAPSDLALMGRYVLTPEVFAQLETTSAGAGGEIQLTDAIRRLAPGGAVVGLEFTGRLLDVGTLESWLATNAEIVWRDPELGPLLHSRIQELELDER